MTARVRRGQVPLETLALMSAVLVMFSMLLFTAKMENQRLADRNSAKRAQIIANKLAFSLEHACDGGSHNTEHLQVYTWSRHITVRYREEDFGSGRVQGIEVEVPRSQFDPAPPTGSAYVNGRHFSASSVGEWKDEPAERYKMEVTCGNLICGSVQLKVQCRHGRVRLFAEGGVPQEDEDD